MSRRTEKNVGVIGLGIIGRRVADCLRRRGFSTFVWNRTPRPFPNFVGSPGEIAQLCDFIQIFVSDDEALLQVVQQMKQSLNAHHIVMAHSTVAPHTMRAAAEMVHRRGAQLLDAPFTGSKMAAEKGELVYYIGGDDAAYRRARPMLEASSKEIVEIGEIGQATTIKVATNMITAATVQVASEALALVHSSGLPLEKFAEAMRSNGSNSGTLTMKLPKMLEGDFEPHFSVKHMLKDVEIATRLARANGLTLRSTEVARESLVDEARQGGGDLDYSAMIRAFFPSGAPSKSEVAGEEQQELEDWEQQRAQSRVDEIQPEAIEAEIKVDAASSELELPEEASSEDDSSSLELVIEDAALKPDEEKAEPEVIEASEVVAEEKPHTPSAVKEAEAPRGFFGRLFGKGTDY